MNLGQLLKKITDKLTSYGNIELVKNVTYSEAINYTARAAYKSLPIATPNGYQFVSLLTYSNQVSDCAYNGFKAEPIYWTANQIYVKITTLSDLVSTSQTMEYHAIFIKKKLGG